MVVVVVVKTAIARGAARGEVHSMVDCGFAYTGPRLNFTRTAKLPSYSVFAPTGERKETVWVE